MNKYLEEGSLTEEEIRRPLRQRTIASEIVPMMCGTAFKNKRRTSDVGRCDRILAISSGYSTGCRYWTKRQNQQHVKQLTMKFSALAFKIMTDPFVGQLIFFRVSRYVTLAIQCTTRSKARKNVSVVFCRCMLTNAKKSKKFAQVTSLLRLV